MLISAQVPLVFVGNLRAQSHLDVGLFRVSVFLVNLLDYALVAFAILIPLHLEFNIFLIESWHKLHNVVTALHWRPLLLVFHFKL